MKIPARGAAARLFCLLFFALFARTPSVFASLSAPQIAQLETFEYRNAEWVNYRLLLERAEEPSLPLIKPGDIILRPDISAGTALHHDLLESLYSRDRRRVFFVVEVTPYYPVEKYSPLPWLPTPSHFYFGNCFWRSDSGIRNAYNAVYGSSAPDFNSTMRRAEIYNQSDVKPQTVVLATIERTGANTMWRNAWGWSSYYHFSGVFTYTP